MLWSFIFMAVLTMRPASAQETPLSSMPPRMRVPVPDAVLYRIFFHHIVAFERAAQASEAKGKLGTPFRNHITRKYGIGLNDQASVARLAIAYDSSEQPLREMRRQLVSTFRNQNFPNGKRATGQALPTIPPEIKQLKQSLDSLALNFRDQLRRTLGDERFVVLDKAIREKFQHDYNTPTSTSGEVKQ